MKTPEDLNETPENTLSSELGKSFATSVASAIGLGVGAWLLGTLKAKIEDRKAVEVNPTETTEE